MNKKDTNKEQNLMEASKLQALSGRKIVLGVTGGIAAY